MMDRETEQYNSKRACGTSRSAGSLYLEVATSPFGRPLEDFLWCPPQPVDIEQLGGSKVGIHYMPPRVVGGKEVYDVFDWVGSDYTNCLDFIGEAQALGFSRKISSSFDFSKLSSQSFIFFIHPRGYIDNFKTYIKTEPEAPRLVKCPANKHRQGDKVEMCARLWTCDLTPGPGTMQGFEEAAETALSLVATRLGISTDTAQKYVNRLKSVTLPCNYRYEAFLQPALTTMRLNDPPSYQPAIIGAFPLGRIVAIKAEDGRHEAKAEKARKSKLPVEVEEA